MIVKFISNFHFLDYRGHWNLLVLCNFGEANPRILLLDSLKTTNPTRLRSAIKRSDIPPSLNPQNNYRKVLLDNMFIYFAIVWLCLQAIRNIKTHDVVPFWSIWLAAIYC